MVVKDWIAEVENGGFCGDEAIAVAVVESVNGFGVIGGIGGGAHVRGKKDRCFELNRKVNRLPPCPILYTLHSHLLFPSPLSLDNFFFSVSFLLLSPPLRSGLPCRVSWNYSIGRSKWTALVPSVSPDPINTQKLSSQLPQVDGLPIARGSDTPLSPDFTLQASGEISVGASSPSRLSMINDNRGAWTNRGASSIL